MTDLIFYIATFLIVYLFYLIFIINKKDRLESFKENMYVKYLENNFKIDLNKIDFRKLVKTIACANSFIIATTAYIVGFVDNYILKILLGMAVLIPFQISIYYLIGKKYKNRK